MIYKFTSLIALTGLIASGCGQITPPTGSSLLIHGKHPDNLSTSLGGSDSNLSAAIQVSALAIGNQMITNIETDLKSQNSLTSEQLGIIAQSAKTELETAVGSLQISSSFSLTDAEIQEPLEIASPAVVAGAVKSIGLSLVDSDSQGKSSVAKNIVGSTFKSLKNGQANFPQNKLAGLASSMVGSAISKLNEAGLGKENAALGANAITSGAIASLDSVGIDEGGVVDVAKAVVSGAVSNLRMDDIGEENMAAVIGQTTQGAIGAMKSVQINSNEEKYAFAGALAASSVSGMKTLKLSNALVVASVKDVSKGAVSALSEAEFPVDTMGGAIQNIASSMVSSLAAVSEDDSVIGETVGAVASGAVSGLSKTGMDETTISSSGVMNNVISGTMDKLGSIGLAQSRVASTMNKVVGGAIESLGESGVKTAGFQQQMIQNVIESTMNGFGSAGLSDVSDISIAMEAMTLGATDALSRGGIHNDQMGASISLVTQTSISHISSIGISESADLKSLSGKVSKGVMTGLGSLKAGGFVTEDEVKTNSSLITSSALDAFDVFTSGGLISLDDYSNFSTEVAGGIIDGLAFSGSNAEEIAIYQEDITYSLETDLGSKGVSASDLTSLRTNIATNATASITLAENLNSKNFPFCQEEYGDHLSDEELLAKVSSLNSAYCLRNTEYYCPYYRFYETQSIDWLEDYTNPGLCEMIKTIYPDVSGDDFATSKLAGATETAYTSTEAFDSTLPYVEVTTNNVVHRSGVLELVELSFFGTNVDLYKYKIGESVNIDCSSETGYSSELSTSYPLTIDFTTYEDGTYTICAIGGNTLGYWQSASTALYNDFVLDGGEVTGGESESGSGSSASGGIAIINEFTLGAVELYIVEAGNLNGYTLTNQDEMSVTLMNGAVSAGQYIQVSFGSELLNSAGDDLLLLDNNGNGVDYIAFSPDGNMSTGSIDYPPSDLSWDGSSIMSDYAGFSDPISYASFSLSTDHIDDDIAGDWEITGSGQGSGSRTYMFDPMYYNNSFGYSNFDYLPFANGALAGLNTPTNQGSYIDITVNSTGYTGGYILEGDQGYSYVLPDFYVESGDTIKVYQSYGHNYSYDYTSNFEFYFYTGDSNTFETSTSFYLTSPTGGS